MASLASSIGLISSLKRREDPGAPILPDEVMYIPTPLPTLTPKMLLIKQALLNELEPAFPMHITLLAVVILEPAELPNAMFPSPVALFARALVPMAVLAAPVVLLESAALPIAMLKLPVVLLKSALSPIAVFREPLLF